MQKHQPNIFFFIIDLPNICSLSGLFCTLISLYSSVTGRFEWAVIGMLWAVVFDWADGFIARRMKGRVQIQGTFGGQLDSLIDMISFGACPAVFLLGYGNFSAWMIPGAFVILAAAALRLSYFNVFGLADSKTYRGLPLDHNIIIFAAVFLFEDLFGRQTFLWIVHGLFMVFTVFNLSGIKMPKLEGKWFYVLIGYATFLTVVYLGC